MRNDLILRKLIWGVKRKMPFFGDFFDGTSKVILNIGGNERADRGNAVCAGVEHLPRAPRCHSTNRPHRAIDRGDDYRLQSLKTE